MNWIPISLAVWALISAPTALILGRMFPRPSHSRGGALFTAVAGGTRSVAAADSATPLPVDDRLRGASRLTPSYPADVAPGVEVTPLGASRVDGSAPRGVPKFPAPDAGEEGPPA